jgi:protein gp37
MPRRWQQPRLIFVNSMSDPFHEDIPNDYIRRVFGVSAIATGINFQVLTNGMSGSPTWLRSYPDRRTSGWGVSIENRRWVQRADYLRRVPAAVRFISAEPLLGRLEGLDLTGIDWLITGGESGHRHRPMNIEWVRELRDRCLRGGVAFFFEQWGGRWPKDGGRLLDDREWSQLPAADATQVSSQI